MTRKKVNPYEAIGHLLKTLEPFDITEQKKILAAVDAYLSTDVRGVFNCTWVVDAEGAKDVSRQGDG